MGRNVPQLRFPEFTAEWEEKTLGDIGKFRKGKLVSSSNVTDSGVPAMMYGDIYVKYNIDFDSVDYRVSEEMAENCVKIHKGDLLFTCSGETDIDIAKCVCYTGSDEVCIGGDILALTPEKDDSLFVAQHQNTYKTAVQKARVSQGHSVVHIYEQQLSALPIHLPCKEEQEKISQFLSKYDKLIRNQEEKISALKERKQGLLKKIFTQQVRFKDQDGNDYPAWEEKTLRGICDIKMCKRVMKHDTAPTGEIPFFKIGTLGGEPDAYISRALFEELKTKYNYPLTGEVMMTCSGTTGNCIQFDGEDSYYQDSNIVWIANDKTIYNNDFLFQFFRQYKWNALEGGTIKRIYTDDVYNAKIPTPCKEEQQRIVDILSAFDKKIEIEQEILNNMQEFKKGLLQKMFI